jgi:hypothetical protein
MRISLFRERASILWCALLAEIPLACLGCRTTPTEEQQYEASVISPAIEYFQGRIPVSELSRSAAGCKRGWGGSARQWIETIKRVESLLSISCLQDLTVSFAHSEVDPEDVRSFFNWRAPWSSGRMSLAELTQMQPDTLRAMVERGLLLFQRGEPKIGGQVLELARLLSCTDIHTRNGYSYDDPLFLGIDLELYAQQTSILQEAYRPEDFYSRHHLLQLRLIRQPDLGGSYRGIDIVRTDEEINHIRELIVKHELDYADAAISKLKRARDQYEVRNARGEARSALEIALTHFRQLPSSSPIASGAFDVFSRLEEYAAAFATEADSPGVKQNPRSAQSRRSAEAHRSVEAFGTWDPVATVGAVDRSILRDVGVDQFPVRCTIQNGIIEIEFTYDWIDPFGNELEGVAHNLRSEIASDGTFVGNTRDTWDQVRWSFSGRVSGNRVSGTIRWDSDTPTVEASGEFTINLN